MFSEAVKNLATTTEKTVTPMYLIFLIIYKVYMALFEVSLGSTWSAFSMMDIPTGYDSLKVNGKLNNIFEN